MDGAGREPMSVGPLISMRAYAPTTQDAAQNPHAGAHGFCYMPNGLPIAAMPCVVNGTLNVTASFAAQYWKVYAQPKTVFKVADLIGPVCSARILANYF